MDDSGEPPLLPGLGGDEEVEEVSVACEPDEFVVPAPFEDFAAEPLFHPVPGFPPFDPSLCPGSEFCVCEFPFC